MSITPFPNAEAELAVSSLPTAAGSSTATQAPDESPVPTPEPQGEATILILSQERGESTTEVVMDWIHALGGRCSRLNGEDLSSPESYSIRFGDRGRELVFHRAEGTLKASDVGVVWFRRWHRYENLGIEEEASDPSLVHRVESHLRKELGVTFGGLCSFLKDAEWLTRPREVSINKLQVLDAAIKVGLRVPDTLLTNSKHEMERFKEKHGRIISKTIGDACCIAAGSEAYVMYTVELTEELLNRSPKAFFPSLAQEMLEKKYEIRVFYLDGECHAMAIFSQLDSRTAVDFRHYNYSRPNREVPYRLPCEIEARIRALMEKLDLGTGSLDLVRTEGGEYVFLEINPVGQFGMVSYPCNYRLEKKVAESLMRRASRA